MALGLKQYPVIQLSLSKQETLENWEAVLAVLGAGDHVIGQSEVLDEHEYCLLASQDWDQVENEWNFVRNHQGQVQAWFQMHQ